MPLPTLYIAEYESFGAEEIEIALKSIPKYAKASDEKIKEKATRILNDLESFAKIEGNECFLGFSGRKLRAKNYVGLIQTKSGFCVEILPKTFRGSGFKELQSAGNQANTKECSCGEKILSKAFDKDRFQGQIEDFIIACSSESNYDLKTPYHSESSYHFDPSCHSERSEESTETHKRDVSPVAQHDKEINALAQHNERAGALTQHTKTPCLSCHINQAKQILLNCLKTLKDSPFKKSDIAALESANLPLLELFVLMFLDECEGLVRRGLKSDYVPISQNRAFFKGRLEPNAHISHNLAHKERFFTTSDEHIADIAPNRLIKSSLHYLLTLNFSSKTHTKLHSMRFVFDAISESKNIESDFIQCENMSRAKEYENLLAWCKIFLQRHTFTPYNGANRAVTFLLPMERLFESFVAHWLKVCGGDFHIKTQESGKYFMRDLSKDSGKDLFCLRPDIVLRRGKEDLKQIIIADTKWKLLDSKDKKYGISQNDLYQMWAYLSKYGVELERLGANKEVWENTDLNNSKSSATTLNASESSLTKSNDSQSNASKNTQSAPLLSAWLIYPLCESAMDLKAKNPTLHFKASQIFQPYKYDKDSYIKLHVVLFPIK